MRLSEIKDEQALDVLADIIEHAAEILSDDEVKRIYREDSKSKLVAYIIKAHKKSVVEIMARLDGKEPEEYSFNLLTLPKKVLEVLSDPELTELFTSQV